jgi:hypothetical protein
MYDASDPRSGLSAATKAPTVGPFSMASFARFYETPPQEQHDGIKTWYVRGQNFVVALSEAAPGAVLARKGQPDEYVALAPDPGTLLEITTKDGTTKADGASIAMIPPGDSTIRLPQGGRLVRFFTTASNDLAAMASNAEDYRDAHRHVAPFVAWPAPIGGYRVRIYSLNVASEPGRFGRIWRCTTFMINYLDVREGRRDPTKMSPHHHDDFEQCSLCLKGAFVHHLRWPWTTNKNHWIDDEHAYCGAPSVAVIPPPAIHTSESVDPGTNQLVDIFCPPRMDFSLKPGWVLNDADYPMPK